MIERLLGRLHNLIRPVRVLASDDAGGVQRSQIRVSDAEIVDGVRTLIAYGLASYPQAGADAVLLSLGGDRQNSIIIAHGDQRYRLHLAAGEVALHDDLGHKVHLSRSGIVVDGGGQIVTIVNTPTLHVDGNIEATGDVKAGPISLNSHKHVGVQPGAGQTGVPI